MQYRGVSIPHQLTDPWIVEQHIADALPPMIVHHPVTLMFFQPIQSVASSTLGPLSCADWSLQNSLLVLSCLRSEVLVWDLSCPSTPALAKTMHDEGVTTAKFSSTHESIIATAGQPNYSVKVSPKTVLGLTAVSADNVAFLQIIDAKASNVLYSSSEKPVGGISWHKRLGYVVRLCWCRHNLYWLTSSGCRRLDETSV